MHIYGKLITTVNGINLDEMRSLLQKALRRKDAFHVRQSYQEMMECGRDQLPWKSLLTFLFEDHCLVDLKSLEGMYVAYQKKDKKMFLNILWKVGWKLIASSVLKFVLFCNHFYCTSFNLYSCDLFQVRTCRIAACMPVYAMSTAMATPGWSPIIECPPSIMGLFQQEDGQLNCDSIVAHLAQAWVNMDAISLMYYSKMMNMMGEIEKCKPSAKGIELVKSNCDIRCTVRTSHVFIAILLQSTHDASMRKFLHICLRMASIPDSPHRLIMFAAVAKLLFGHEAATSPVESGLQDIDWESSATLEMIPNYALDKHTYRGRTGNSTKNLKEQGDMSNERYEEFHGKRNKRDIEYFFSEGTTMDFQSLDSNPLWEVTKDTYRAHEANKQKTVYMTILYYSSLKKTTPYLFTEAVDNALPLLQRPTHSNKVYTRLDIANNQVVKGPYTQKKYDIALDFHTAMQEMGDRHTLPVTEDIPYLRFPLVKLQDRVPTTQKANFYDPIAKCMTEVDFVTRDSLGIVQLHRLSADEIRQLPVSVWVHYALRYSLNVGDSGLYNAIWNGEKVFGIDMEEKRKNVDTTSLCSMLFTKKPKKELCDAVEMSVRANTMLFLEPLYTVLGEAMVEGKRGAEFVQRLQTLITFIVERFD